MTNTTRGIDFLMDKVLLKKFTEAGLNISKFFKDWQQQEFKKMSRWGKMT